MPPTSSAPAPSLGGPNTSMLINMFSTPTLYDRLFSYCAGTTSPACLARVHPDAALAFQDYITRSWRQRLIRYFPDPLEFRSMQARTGCLVSGSLPLQVLSAQDYGTDADLYPWPGTEHAWGVWLSEQGFTLALKDEPGATFDSVMAKVQLLGWQIYGDNGRSGYRGCHEVAAVFSFVKNIATAKGVTRLHVQLVVSKHSPVATILGFHSTLVTNLMTWDRLYCLFPRTTFEEGAMIVLRPDKHMESEAVFKYVLRGFTERYTFPTDMRIQDRRSDATGSELAMTRWVGDRYTWTVNLSTAGVVRPSTPHVDVTLYGFTLQQMSPAFCAESESDRDTPPPGEQMTSGRIRVLVDMIDAVPWGEAPGGLSVPYTAPHDFSHTLQALDAASQDSCRACRGYVFDIREDTGRDGAMRVAKLAYERQRAGKFGPMPMLVLHKAAHVIVVQDKDDAMGAED